MRTVLLILLLAVTVATQQPAPTTIALPAKASTQLKQITDRQAELSREYSALEASKVIVVQRAALELHLTAEQLDAMDLVAGATGFEFKPKEKAQAATPKKETTP